MNQVRHEVGAAQSPYSMVSRLFRNHLITFSGPFHALIDDSVNAILSQEPHWQVGYLQSVAIQHQGYKKDASGNKDKTKKALVAMKDYLRRHSQDPYLYSKLSALYVETGKINQGVELLNKGLNLIQF